MKYPEVISFDDALPRLDRFDAIIDARSPSEFALDHLPGAINCPVLDDAQRIHVGTLYKQASPFEARKIGAALVAQNVGRMIETLWLDRPREWTPLVYCWRGGNRSGALAHIMARIGWPVAQLDGGYKAFRHHVNLALEQPPALPLRVICGPTGSGKTRLLETLHAAGAQVLDLEQLARHRGSVLGQLPMLPQPGQKAFENRIWDTLRRFDASRPVFVESESKKVGQLRVPAALMDAMRASPCVSLLLSPENRVRLLLEDYAHFADSPDALNGQLEHLAPLHGREKIKRWQQMASGGQMPALVAELLAGHYDPAYLKSIARNFVRFDQARVVQLDDISAAAFEAAAGLLQAG